MRTLIAVILILICSPVLCISEESKPYGFYNFRSAWIESLGQYGPAEIDVKEGDVVKVDLIGSASESGFYYSIVETTGNAEIIDASPQVIINQENRWKSITTIGLFRAKAHTRLRFSANFIKGDQSGRIRVFGLTLIASVLGKRSELAGLWHWFNKAIVTFSDDGTCNATNGSIGIWRELDSRRYEIRWIPKGEKEVKYIDTVQLSPDGNILEGKNQDGNPVSGKRIKQ